MAWDYKTLQKAYYNKVAIGKFKGQDIYVESKNSGDSCFLKGNYYLLYDDGNLLVERVTNETMVSLGTVNSRGIFHEWPQGCKVWKPSTEIRDRVKERKEKREELLVLDIDKLLAEAVDTSIFDGLLAQP